MHSTAPTGSERLKLWITGCGGFLGTRLTRHFAAQGHNIVGLSRRSCFPVDSSVAIDLAAADARRTLGELIAERGVPDVVIHAAAKQPGSGDLSEFIDSNVRTTSNLLAALEDSPPRQIIFTSTLSVYGRPGPLPVRETNPAGGNLPYGATKRWAEQLCESFQQRSSIVVLRLPSLFGAGQEDSFIDGLARSAKRGEPLELFSRGELIRDALHVSDVVKAIDACIRLPPTDTFSLLNLGCGQAIKTIDYARQLVDALGSDSDIIPIDRQASHFDLYADITEARRQIAFEPMSLADSLYVYANELRA
jgi:nucleoside-diphosphate-sugar epimerase